MWSRDVCSKAWLLLWRAGSNPSLREEGPSLRSGSRRLRQLLHGMGSISHRFTTPMDQWRTDFIARRKVERMSAWAKDQFELPNHLSEISGGPGVGSPRKAELAGARGDK